MSKRWLIAACAVWLAACGKNESAAPAAAPAAPRPQAAAPQAAAPASRADALKIKGFYIGMDIHGVPDAMVDLLAEQGLSGYGFTDVIRYSDGQQCVLLYDKQFLRTIEARMTEHYDQRRAKEKTEEELQNSCYASDGVLVVKSGADGAVNSVEFNNAGELFEGQKKVAPEEIVKKLVNEYHIPAMKPNDEHNGWRYFAPDGSRVDVVVRQVFGIPVTRLVMSKAGN